VAAHLQDSHGRSWIRGTLDSNENWFRGRLDVTGSIEGRCPKVPNDPHDDALAHDMIEVHGSAAAAVARANARAAALAGTIALAKSWIGVVGAIQRQAPRRNIAVEKSFK
jgi:hypothetical protein